MTSCPQTGLAVPECSCQRCIEEQLRQFQPELLREVRADRNRSSTPPPVRSDQGRLAA
jgi:hypothetical protein